MALDMSVVIGFRDWGSRRLESSARSIIESFGSVRGELIISDYCSADPDTAAGVAEAVGARLVRSEGDLVWSRSRALNAGFAVAQGELLISTDADMLFAPKSMERIYEWWASSRDSSFLLQCRDLPQETTEVALASGVPNWHELRRRAVFRPRWGMGGMMAIGRSKLAMLRGFDERLHTYGREDMDFAMRCRRAGIRNVWIEDPEVQMFHMWHQTALDTLTESAVGRTAAVANRRIVDADDSWCRNLSRWQSPLDETQPLVSFIAAPIKDMSAFLAMFSSIQAQSVGEWELIIGQTGPKQGDSLESPLSADPRVKFASSDSANLPVAPTTVVSIAAGTFVMAVEEDCVYPPNFLALQVSAFTAGTSMVHCKRTDIGHGFQPVAKQPVLDTWRGTLYLRTAVAALSDSVPMGPPWPQMTDRLTKIGCRAAFNDSGVFFRVHYDAGAGAIPEAALELNKEIARYAPDGFVVRNINIEAADRNLSDASFDGALVLSTLVRDGEIVRLSADIAGATYRDLGTLRNLQTDYTIEVDSQNVSRATTALRRLVTDVISIAKALESTPVAVALLQDEANFGPIASDLIWVAQFSSDGVGSSSLGALFMLEQSAVERVLGSLRSRVAMFLTWGEESVDDEV